MSPPRCQTAPPRSLQYSTRSSCHTPELLSDPMRIFRVVHEERDKTQPPRISWLWDNYRSASTSKGQHSGTVVEVADVPEELWKPVNKRQESLEARLESAAHRLAHLDPEQAQAVLTQLMERVVWIKNARTVSPLERKQVLPEEVRAAAQELLALEGM